VKTLTATIERSGIEFDIKFQYEIEPGERADMDYPGSEPSVLIYAEEVLTEDEYLELERFVLENEK